MTRSNLQAIGVVLVGVGAGLAIAGVGFGAEIATLLSKRFVVV
ncbi:MAG: hypothetical protein ABEJ44_01220 [Halanaeroarchaeum sp.]